MHYSRGVVLLSGAILFCVLAAWAQDIPTNASQTKNYPVTGTIVNSVTGKPIPRTLVRISQRAVLTGPQGDFAFDNVPAGKAEIVVSKPGFFHPGQPHSLYMGYMGDQSPYSVDVSADTKVVLKLEPEAVVSGTIQGEDDEPLEGVRINVLTSQVVNGRRQLTPVRRSRVSDEDGNFRIGGLAPGRYYLAITPGHLPRTILGAPSAKSGESYPVMVYFPSAEDIADATPIDLAPGQHQEANFSLKMLPSFKVAGTVVNAGGWMQMQAPELVDEFEQPLLNPDRFDQQSGAFEFRAVPAGSYWLRVGAIGQDGAYSAAYHRIQVQSTLTALRIPMEQGLNIPVIVHTDFVHENLARGHCTTTESDSGEVHESDCSDYPAVRLELDSLDFARLQFQTDFGPLKDGVRVRGVRPGRYTVRATPTFGGYVQSIRCGSLDLLREPLVVPEDASIGEIEVVLRDDPGTLSIQVRAQKPGQETVVLVFPDPVTSAETEMTSSSRSGEAAGFQVAPGTYKIFAFDPADGVDYSNFDTLTKYLSQAASVTVGAEENASVVVDVIHIGE